MRRNALIAGALAALALAATLSYRLDDWFHPLPNRPDAPFPAPVQRELPGRTAVFLGDKNFVFEARATYSLDARILSAERYRLGALADVVPVDLALAWGPVAEPHVYPQFSIRQSNRWFYWTLKDPAIARELGTRTITSSMANTHMVPASEEVREVLLRAKAGQAVKASGYLVDIRHPEPSNQRRTSRRRTDTGEGSCEIFYVIEAALYVPHG